MISLSSRSSNRNVARRSGQRGVVMFVALVVLIVMTLAGLAMLRQMGGGVSIAGNVAFKQGATAAADAGVEAAREWMVTNAAVLNLDNLAAGYHSSWNNNVVDPAQFIWTNAESAAVPAAMAPGFNNDTRYIVHRLCQTPNLPVNDPAQVCADSAAQANGASKGGASYGNTPAAASLQAYYRITTRVVGPRNTVSYTQVVMGP